MPKRVLLLMLLFLSANILVAQPGNALDFDGSNDRVTVSTMPMTHITNFTMEAWIYPKTFTNFQTLFTYGYGDATTGNGIGLMIDASGQLVLNFPNGGGGVNTGTTLPTTNRWYHVALTRTGGVTRVYLDGVLATTSSSLNPVAPTAFYLGGYNGILHFNGRLDEFRFYNTALTATQIQAEMFTTTSTLLANLVNHYDFDNGVASANNASITTLSDISGNNRNGTLNNFGLNGNSSNWVESYAMVVPTATAATSVTATGFTANWTAPTIGTLDNYLLDVSTNPLFTGAISGSPFTVASGTTSRAITGLIAGTYYYRVRAEKTSVTGQGIPSNTIAQSFAYTTPGNALDFDGSNDHTTVSSIPMTNISNFTMEGWVYPKSFTNHQTLFTYGYGDGTTGNGIGLMVDATGQLVLNFPTAGGIVNTGAILPSANRWYHVAVTRTSGVTRVYLNGVLATTTSSLNPATPTAFYLGGYNGTLYFNGRMDEFRFYNTALTATQIQAEMFTTTSTLPANLIVHYNFDNGVASANNAGITTLSDISGNNRNGTLNNFGLNGNSSNWVESYAMVVPTATAATSVIATGFTANWNLAPLGVVDNYILDVSTNPSFTGSVSGSPFTLSNSTTSQAITGLIAGTYYYRVRAEKASVTGQGSPSNTIAQSFAYTPPGNALDFDGSNDHVTVSSIPMTNISNFTMEGWIYPRSLTGTHNLFAYGYDDGIIGNGVSLSLLNGQLWLNHSGQGGTGAGTTIPAANTWYHIAITRTGGVTRAYLNGVVAPNTNSVAVNSPSEFRLGSNSGIRFFNGRMDEFRMYNTALTATQIQAEMFTTTSTLPANLIVHYNFDNGVASANNTGITTLSDISGNNRNGTLNNFGLNGNSSNWVESYAMVIPTATAASYVTSNGFTANWTAPTIGTLDNYLLDVSTSSTFASFVSGYNGLSVSGTSQAIIGLSSGATYYYRLRANKASVTGQGGNSNTITQLVPYSPPGNALNFDGSNDFVSLASNPVSGLTNFTIESWFLLNNTNAWQRIFDFGTNTNVYMFFTPFSGVGSLPRFAITTSSGGGEQMVTGTSPLSTGRWHHFAISYNATTTTLTMYINGVQAAQNTAVTLSPTSLGAITNYWIGRSSYSVDPYFSGSIDEFRIWNTTRTATQIQENMYSVVPTNSAGLIEYYNFDNGVSCVNNTGLTTLSDATTTANNGTLNNFALTTGCTSNWVESYAMVVPTATAATNITSSGFTANWTAPATGTVNNYLLDVSTNVSFSSFVSGYNGLSVSGTSTTVIGLAQGTTYYYRVRANKTSVSGQGAHSNAITVSTPSTTTWNGTTWSNGAPTSTIDAIIASSTAPASFTCKTLTINSGVSLTITGITATVNGNIVNNGNGIAGTGNVVIATNAAFTGTAFSFSGSLTVNSGVTLTTNNNLTLASDVNNTGRIANSAGTINGNVTTETYIPGGRRAFRFLSHPFTAAQAMSSLVDDIFVTGSGAGFDATTTNASSSFWFNDASNTWTTFSSTSDASWAQHRGARVLVRGDRTQANSLTGAAYTPNAVTLDMTGAVNTGNQNINVPTSGNFHLVSNPYPSPTDIGTVIDAATNIGTTYWVWDANAVTRGAYVPLTKGSGAYNLAMNGAFFVQPTATTTLAFTESNKVAAATANLFRTQATQNQLELQVNYNGTYADKLFVRNSTTATAGKELTEDGNKLMNPEVNVYTLATSNEALTLDARPIASTTVIPMGFTSSLQSNFEIALNSNTLNNGLPIVLKDKFLNVEHVLTATSPYNFTVTSNAASQGTNRFELVFRTSSALPTTFVNVAAQQKGSAIEVSFNTANESNMHSYEVEESKDGSSFTKGTTLEAKNAATNNYSWLDVNVHNGNNYYRVKAIEKNGVVKYSQVVRVNIGTKRSEFTVYPNPVKGGTINLQLTDIEKGVYTVKVINNLGQEIAAKQITHNGGSATQTISIGNAPTGKYNMIITNGATTVTKTVIVE